MNVERIGSRCAFSSSVIGLAILVVPSAAWSQQERAEQGDVQVAVAPGDEPQAAEQQQPMWNEVRVVHVKGDRTAEFEGLIKELSAALAESDAPGFNIWQVALGDQYTYHIATQLPSLAAFAEMDTPPMEPQEWANWINRIESTIDSQTLMMAQIHPDLSIMPEGQQAAAQSQAGQQPELLMLVSHTLLPGKRQEYVAWLRDEMLPALRQSDVIGVVSNEIAFGSESRTWVYAVPIQSWSELDQPSPLHRSMGAQAAEELLSRGDSMVDSSETILLRTRLDLLAGGEAGAQSGSQAAGAQ